MLKPDLSHGRHQILDRQKASVLQDLGPKVLQLIESHERKCVDWWPSNLLPRAYCPGDAVRLKELQAASRGIPTEARTCLALNLLTEEGLPSFSNGLGAYLLPGTPLGDWLRRWTAEEGRHGRVIRDYVSITGILDELSLDRMTFSYLQAGWNPGFESDPYQVFVYTSLQERATQISHSSTADIAKQHDPILTSILREVAIDEARHYSFYRTVLNEILARDLDAALESCLAIMPLLAMPGGTIPQFKELAEVAYRMNVYSLRDYGEIVLELLRFWEIEHREPMTDVGRMSQERLLAIPDRLTRVADRMETGRIQKAFRFDVTFGKEFIL